MLTNYNVKSDLDKENAMKEIIQEMVLYALSKTDFFKKAAFYGGTCLRIFYGLDRFSEDLDFSLINKDINFNFNDYFTVLERELKAFGLNVRVEEKLKKKDSTIRSAFLKADTKEHLMIFYNDNNKILPNKKTVLKIKFEIDINPPDYANFETKFRLLPSPYQIKLYDTASLFAGKIHAILLRKWKNRTKGRDLYDYIFYLSKNYQYNHIHLCERLHQSGIEKAHNLKTLDIKNMLISRFEEINYKDAKNDVLPFIKDPTCLDIWSKEFFIDITDKLKKAI